MTLTADQVVEILKAVGPAALAAVGVVLAGLLSAIGWGLRFMWRTHKRQMSQMAAALTKLAQAVDADRKTHGEEIQVIREGMTAIKVEVALTNRSVETATAHVHKLSGVVEAQQREIKENTKVLERTTGKLEAVFRFIDAPPRATDPRPPPG